MKYLGRALMILAALAAIVKMVEWVIGLTSVDRTLAAAPLEQEMKDLTARIEVLRGNMATLQTRLDAARGSLKQEYEALTRKRQALKPGDDFSLQQYNTEAAAYEARNAEVAALAKELEGWSSQLNALAERRGVLKETAARTPQVVMYSTRSCPACRQAEAYFARNGIPYRHEGRRVSRGGGRVPETGAQCRPGHCHQWGDQPGIFRGLGTKPARPQVSGIFFFPPA